jgi:hypothetical protein
MIASAARKTRSEAGTRGPNSEITPSANAMSVAAGIAQPWAAGPGLKARYTTAGTAMPPAAAIPGRRRRDQVASCPSSASRLISRPTNRKNTAIRPSLIQWPTESGPSWICSVFW